MDPLDSLRPIVLPSHKISLWPIAPGWWGLLLLLIIGTAVIYLLRPRWQQRKRRQQIRANTQQLLDNLYTACCAETDPTRGLQNYLQRSNEIFKRLVLTNPRYQDLQNGSAGSLISNEWIEFIQKTTQRSDGEQAIYASLYGDTLYAARCNKTVDGKPLRLQELHAWALRKAEDLAA